MRTCLDQLHEFSSRTRLQPIIIDGDRLELLALLQRLEQLDHALIFNPVLGHVDLLQAALCL